MPLSSAPSGICRSTSNSGEPDVAEYDTYDIEDIRKLEPGHLAVCSASGTTVRPYWDIPLVPDDDVCGITLFRSCMPVVRCNKMIVGT